MARNESLELWGIIRRELLAGELITYKIAGVGQDISSPLYLWARGGECHRTPIVGGVSRDKRSV